MPLSFIEIVVERVENKPLWVLFARKPSKHVLKARVSTFKNWTKLDWLKNTCTQSMRHEHDNRI